MTSLTAKLGLLAVTMVLVVWIGWEPPAQEASRSRQSEAALDATRQPGPGVLGRLRDSSHAAKLDLNRATIDELATLPGVGPVLAKRIAEQRAIRGLYRQIEDLLEVEGIGQKRLERIRPLVLLSPQVDSPRASTDRAPSALPSVRRS